MVFSGKPSPGCANCRRSKKSCSLERPACARCVKRKIDCTGYRDAMQLVFRQVNVSARYSVQRTTAKIRFVSEKESGVNARSKRRPSDLCPSPDTEKEGHDSVTSIKTCELLDFEQPTGEDLIEPGMSVSSTSPPTIIPTKLQPTPDDIATTYFFVNFTSNEHWSFLRESVHHVLADPCLDFAIRACGMAVLANLHPIQLGHNYAQSMYGRAVSLVNLALCDPERSLKDETLVAVRILGYFENMTCHRTQSVESWEAHMNGAAQLLKLRGREQFRTETGRVLFRDTRAQILGYCIFRDRESPQFLHDYQTELERHTPAMRRPFTKFVDEMALLTHSYARLRVRILTKSLPDPVALRMAEDLDGRYVEWESKARLDHMWAYDECTTEDDSRSEHVWNGKFFKYSCYLVPHIWNIWRSQRIMIARTRELLSRRVALTQEERDRQTRVCRQLRVRMAEEICATTPARLGHVGGSSSAAACVLMAAYGSVFPLFLAATCTLERAGFVARLMEDGSPMMPTLMQAGTFAQVRWILGRLRYIVEKLGVGWASRVAYPLRWEFKVQTDDASNLIESWKLDITTPQSTPWLRKIGEEIVPLSTTCV